jgi:hypothetical protein
MTNIQLEDTIDQEFILKVQQEVTQSCALPFALPVDRIPFFIQQAAMYFWQNDDLAVEERIYVIKNSDICKNGTMNKIVKLPEQIMGVHGCFKLQQSLRHGVMGDFSLERMMMSSYSMFGGAGTVGGGFSNTNGMSGYTLTDVMSSLYEVDTFNQMLNPPLTYTYNAFSKKLAILGDLRTSDLLISCMVRCKIQDLYNNYYFFRYVVCLAKRALATIYGTWEFKYPGGVTINYSNLSDQADSEIEQIKEYFEQNRACDYFFQPNSL